MRSKLLRTRPKPPVNAFIGFVQAQKERISKEHPKISIAEITSIASKEWKDMTQEEKQPYIDEFERRQQGYKAIQ